MTDVPAWLKRYVVAARQTPREVVARVPVEKVAQANGVPAPAPDNLPKGVVPIWNGTAIRYRARTSGADRKWLGTFDTPGQAAEAIRKETK